MEDTTKPFLVAAPATAILDSWSLEARKFSLAHLLNQIELTTYRSLSKALVGGRYYKLYRDECPTLNDSHEPSLKTLVARKQSILGLTVRPHTVGLGEGTANGHVLPMRMDYTTDEALLAGLLNDYCLIEHHLPLSSVRDYVVTLKYGQQFTNNQRAGYQY